MYWNLQGIPLQISGDMEKISREDRQLGQIKCDNRIMIITWKKRTKKAVRRGAASAANCGQLNGTKKEKTEVRTIKLKLKEETR